MVCRARRAVVGRMERVVHERLGQVRRPDQPQELRLPLVAGPLGVVARRLGQDLGSSVPIGPGDHAFDGAVVVAGRRSAWASARSSSPPRACAARSSSVRLIEVLGMPSWLVTSWASRERERCRRIPGAPWRPRGAVTSMRVWSVRSRPRWAAALRWLRTAPGPQASPPPAAGPPIDPVAPTRVEPGEPVERRPQGRRRRASSAGRKRRDRRPLVRGHRATVARGGGSLDQGLSGSREPTPRGSQASRDRGPCERHKSAQPLTRSSAA